MILPQAQTPIIVSNKPIDDNNTINMHEYTLKLNEEKSFKILLNLNEEKKVINIKAVPNEDFYQKEYEKLLSLNELIIYLFLDFSF